MYSPTQEGLEEWASLNQIKKMEMGDLNYEDRDMSVIDYRKDKYSKVGEDSLQAGN